MSNNNEQRDEKSSIKDDATLSLHRAIVAAQHMADGTVSAEGVGNEPAENSAVQPEEVENKNAEAEQEKPSGEDPAYTARNSF